MSKNLDPKILNLKKVGYPLFGITTKKILFKKGFNKDIFCNRYTQILKEKRKVRYNYGISLKQIKQYQNKNKSNINLILESRIDVFLFNLGFCISIKQARQLVTHKHIYVNCNVVTKPGKLLYPTDIVWINHTSSINIKKQIFFNISCRYKQLNSIMSIIDTTQTTIYTICLYTLKGRFNKTLSPRDPLLKLNTFLLQNI